MRWRGNRWCQTIAIRSAFRERKSMVAQSLGSKFASSVTMVSIGAAGWRRCVHACSVIH